jgi:hypothetical protein
MKDLIDNISYIYKNREATQVDRENAKNSLFELVGQLESAPESDWKSTSIVFSGMPHLLLDYARAASIQAVRTGNNNWIRIGIFCVALDELNTDIRDTLINLSLLFNSANILSFDLHEVIDKLSKLCSGKMLHIINSYKSRSSEDRSILLMGYKESSSTYGFTYEQIDV